MQTMVMIKMDQVMIDLMRRQKEEIQQTMDQVTRKFRQLIAILGLLYLKEQMTTRNHLSKSNQTDKRPQRKGWKSN